MFNQIIYYEFRVITWTSLLIERFDSLEMDRVGGILNLPTELTEICKKLTE
jgi:hypothetical protein